MNFGEYMFSLLPGPLKRGKRALNQLCIFLQVLGRSFDQCKQVLLRVREEASVLTCSDTMLPVHGQDRDMLRLDGETLENYRIRLALKASIAEKAGTNEGIRYLARAFDTTRWRSSPEQSRTTGPRPPCGSSAAISYWMTGTCSFRSSTR